MNNPKAIKLIDKIQDELNRLGIITNTLIEDLTELRKLALNEVVKIPKIVKILRLTYEHIGENETFLIPIPDDEPIEDEPTEEGEEETIVKETTPPEVNPVESLSYLISLIKDCHNKLNLSDLNAYRDALSEY